MASCSASHALAQRQKSQKSSCATCYLPMTQPLQPTQMRPYRDLLTASLSCAKALASPSASKRPMSVHKMLVNVPPSKSMTTPWMWWMSVICLGSTISTNFCLDTEINKRKWKASATMAKLTQRVWKNSLLTQNTKVRVYQVCILSTLLYGSETLDHLHAPVTSTQHFQHALPEAYPAYQVAGPFTQQRHSHAYRGPFYVLSPDPAALQVAWPCAAHGGRPHSQKRPLG